MADDIESSRFVPHFNVGSLSDKFDYTAKIKAMDKLLGRPSAGQVCIRTKENDYIRDSAAFAETLV